ncbi:MAG TPA: hypothetical protein DEA08_00500 [Planctomycetes bacterium]|nr:hypothetical protein [Planctomycetota bacterium]
MKPAPAEDATERRLLSNHPSVGTGSARGAGCLVLFGLPFFAAGVIGLLAGAGRVHLQGNEAPLWVLGVLGAVFAAVGVGCMAVGVRSTLRERKLVSDFETYAEEPWKLDAWDPHFAPNVGGSFLGRLASASFAVLFLVPFNYFVLLAPKRPSPLFAKALVAFFDLFALGLLSYALYLVFRRLKYRDGRLRYPSFPLFVRDPVRLTLHLPRALQGRFEELSCVLRQAEQLWEERGEQNALTTYELHRQERRFRRDEVERALPLEFELPAESPTTELHGDTVRFYELEVSAETPGIDYRAIYLLPIYR